MNATRVPYTARVTLLMLALACACMACSAPAPPAGDADNAPPEPAHAATTPAPDMPSAEAATPVTPVTETAAPSAALPAQTTSPAATGATPLPATKPRPTTISKTPVKPAPSPIPPATDAKDMSPAYITIDALSRGKGVPTETREALRQIRALLERQQAASAVTALQYQRIGIEGESRLCVEFRNASDAQSALAEIRKIAAGVDLLNVVEAPCPSNKGIEP